MTPFMVRQGDVIIAATTDEPPLDATPAQRDAGRVILAYGEVTGHAHAIADPDVELLTTANAVDRWLRVGAGGATVVHDEHGALTLPPGHYRVRLEREYSPEAIRNVAD